MKKFNLNSARKIFALWIFLFACICGASAQSSIKVHKQILTPQQVFVGFSSCKLQCNFYSAADFFSIASQEKIENNVLKLDLTGPQFKGLEEKCTILNAVLKQDKFEGSEYSLEIDFIPWQAGSLVFPSFDLISLIRDEQDSDSTKCIIALKPVKISSILEKYNETTLKPPVSPIEIPGTSYAVWTFIVALILLLVIICAVLAKLPKITRKIAQMKSRVAFKKNEKNTTKKLNSILKKKITDADFGEQWQKIMRNYLNSRFGFDFSTVPSSRIAKVISNVTGDMLDEKEESVVMSICAMFVRTDYIRFAQGSIDSKLLPSNEHKAEFAKGERKEIIKRSIALIHYLDNPASMEEEL